MKAMQYFGPRDIRYETAEDPAILNPTDLIVRIERCSICGSDLHLYHGESYRGGETGFCVGHEAVGEIVEVGSAITGRKPGDKVMLPGSVGCGSCPSCRSGDVIACTTMNEYCYGVGHALPGCQAEAVRVPFGDFNAIAVPEGVTEDQALLMTDALATAWFGCRNAEIAAGKTVAIVGLGPIGLLAVEISIALGAAEVFAIDLLPERRAIAAGLGAVPLGPVDAIEVVREHTQGRKVDCVVEAVGAQATIALALRLARQRGIVSVVGVSTDRRIEFPMAYVLANSLTLRTGICSVHDQLASLVPLVQSGRLRPERVISHVMPLSDGERAYRLFDTRADNALKMVLVA